MTKRRALPAAVCVLLLAAFLRFHLLEVQSFWNDEGNSARLSERSLPAILEGTASDVHPPLYYVLLRGWRELVGETEFGLRSLSAFAGVLTVAGVMALARATPNGRRRPTADDRPRSLDPWPPAGRRLLDDAPGWPAVVIAVTGLLAAFSPVLVYYSQETRMYALLALLAALSAWALLAWLGAARPSRGWAAAYVLLLAAGLYTHYFFPAVIAAQGVVVALWWRRPGWITDGAQGERRARRLWAWVGLAAAAVALYLPWAPIFIRQIGGRSGGPVALADFMAESGRWLIVGSTVSAGEASWALMAAAALAGVGLWSGGRRAAASIVLAMIPLGLLFLAGATDPAFYKFMLVVVPFVLALMGLAWRARGPGRMVAAVLSIAVLAGSLVSLGNLYGDPAFARADYRGMAARIAADNQPDAGIILVAPNQWEAFTYYHRDGAPVYPLPRGRPDPAILEPELATIAAAHDRLYALYWGAEQRDPQGIIERWLDAHAFKAWEEWVGDVRFVVYGLAGETAAGLTPSGATFAGLDGETITLHAYAVGPLSARPGEIVTARLEWSADAAPRRAYKVYWHLLDGAGQVVAQRDGEPAGAARPTTGWQPGERLAGGHGLLLPPGLPPGVYTLRLGLYDALDPSTRLGVGGADGVTLGTITIP